jgi:two-component system, OmpR family, sensor histidine kinase CpxA
MSSVRKPLYVRFLLWSALNLLFIIVLAYAYAPRGQTGLNLLLTQSVRERLSAIALGVADDLYNVDAAKWPQVIAQHQEIAHVRYAVRVRPLPPPPPRDAPRDAPPPRDASSDRDAPPEFQPGSPPPGPEEPLDRPPPAGGRGPAGPFGPRNADITIRAADGAGYDVRVGVIAAGHGGPPRVYLVTAHADDGFALLRLLGLGREIAFIAAALLLSALLWWPFIWRITRRVGALAAATQQMSRGRLDTRVADAQRDELGELAQSINSMAERLDALMTGQRQFVADVAHEVISPIARMQIGLGILEGRISSSELAALNDVRDDLEQMAGMLEELLLFSRSGMQADRAPLIQIELAPMIEKIISAESGDARINSDVPPGLSVMGQAAMLARALANLIRNARRYASAGTVPVEIAARRENERVKVLIRDRGPGVPEAALARLGEPFFRPEVARSRSTGGFGLGLAIVRRCIAACEGEVKFRNREGGGFEVELDLPAGTRV